jgi:hypothetical protein
MKFEVTTKIVDESKILQDVTTDCGLNDVRTKVFSQVIDTQDAGIQDALRQLGWTKAEEDFKWQPISTLTDRDDYFVVIGIDVKSYNDVPYTTSPYLVKGNSLVNWPYFFKPTHWFPIPQSDRLKAV